MELGCSAGVGAVGLAAEMLGGRSQNSILVVSVELSSPGLQSVDPSMTDMVANLLFGDAAAAVVLTTQASGRGPQVLASQSALWSDSLDHLGMDLTDTGFRLVLSPRLPGLIRRRLAGTLNAFLERHGLRTADIKFWALHPGGPKILEAVTRSLALPDHAVQPTWDTWENYGNLSSTTVFFVLRRIHDIAPPSPGDLGMMIAFGPGLTCELVLLRAAGWLTDAS
jgi:alkylresorcinol/alkylpyrone synthase